MLDYGQPHGARVSRLTKGERNTGASGIWLEFDYFPARRRPDTFIRPS
jgi:hypothetical protein